MTALAWLLTVLSLVGVVLNIKRKKACFYVWGVTNFGWVVVDYSAGLYAQAALFTIYTVLAVYGIYEWSKSHVQDKG